jgi:ABC-type nickel/cobalt efflux system permease component RcnA
MKILAAVACLMIALMLSWPASAQETASPFAKPVDSGASAAPPPAAASGIITSIGRTFVSLQRSVNRAINDRLMAIKRGEERGALWGGLAVAFLYGVFHALGPGHGKTVVIGYFLGRTARPWRGVAMAGWIAVSHVMGAVVVVGIARLIFEKSLVSPTNEFLWLRVASYGAIVLIGLMMLRDWARGGHDHPHHDHAGCDDHGHAHACHAGDTGWLKSHAPLEQRALALAAGFVPCSGAILILLFTMANGLLLAGIAMATAIALGMGLTLAGLGVASILLRHQVTVRLPEGGRTGRWLALSGPVFVIAIGSILLAASLLTQVSL